MRGAARITRSIRRALFISALIFMAGLFVQTGPLAEEGIGKAVFAGGCFWCMESDFEGIGGVRDVVSGYIGGMGSNPTYKDYGRKGHIEAVEITYDPSLITYSELLDLFWLRIDPTDGGGQFCDRGHEYTTAIFYRTEKQRRLAERSKAGLESSGRLKGRVATRILRDNGFYRAEEYHQDYYKKNPLRYKYYRYNCGRDQRLRELWGEAPSHGG
jgi:methionine-S-sulfoxide reductase